MGLQSVFSAVSTLLKQKSMLVHTEENVQVSLIWIENHKNASAYDGYGHEWFFESGFTMDIFSTFLFSWIEVMLLTPLYTYNDF